MTDNPDGDRGDFPRSLQSLATYAELFAAPDFKCGVWEGAAPLGELGQMPYFDYSPLVARFIADAYAQKWTLDQFDWPSWKNTEEFRKLMTDTDVLASATPRQLQQLITTVLRQDRFAEGTLAEAFESGLMRRIAERARDIVNGKA